MDESCNKSGTYVPYSSYPFGTLLAGSLSPPPSLCNEPIFQIPKSDGGCGSTGIQQKVPKIQLLNKTVVDARSNKSNPLRGQNTSSRVQPSNMANFFLGQESLSDFSEGGDGSLKGFPVSPLYNFGNAPLQFSQVESTSVHWPQAVKPVKCQQFENIFQHPKQQNIHKFTQPFVGFGNENQVAFQKGMQNTTMSRDKIWGQHSSAGYLSATNPALQSKTANKSKSVENTKTRAKKKGLISSSNVNMLRARRKQRKKIQQKNKSLHKTELCTHWMLTSTCTFDEKCYFAHGIEELKKRVRVGNFKTQPCVDCPREKSNCMFGSRCNYCHPGEAMRRTGGSIYFDVDYYKDLKREFPNTDYPFGIFL